MPHQRIYPSRLPEDDERPDGSTFPKVEIAWGGTDLEVRLVRHISDTEIELVDALPLSDEGMRQLVNAGRRALSATRRERRRLRTA